MPKLHKIKYEEAVQRNVNSAIRRKVTKYQGKPVNEVKSALGLRLDDNRFNSQIKILIEGK